MSMKKRKSILSVGEIIWDVFDGGARIGGATLNFAAHCALLGADSNLLSAVGYDELGDKAMNAISDLGVRMELIERVNYPTGSCKVTLDDKGVPRYDVARDVAYDHLTLPQKELPTYDALYFGTLIQRSDDSRAVLKSVLAGKKARVVMCDVNLRKDCYNEESAQLCLSSATILKISKEEEPLLRSMGLYTPISSSELDVAKAIADRYKNISVIVFTKGSDGSSAYCRNGEAVYQPALGGTAVSTVGAGDSFSAAFLMSYLRGQSVAEALKNGAELGGYVVACEGAVPLDSHSIGFYSKFKGVEE